MISFELRRFLTEARDALPLEREWSMMKALPEGVHVPPGGRWPSGYRELMEVANGGIFGQVVIFGVSVVGKMQFYAEVRDGVPVALGRDGWFCFGKVNEDPIYISWQDGSDLGISG